MPFLESAKSIIYAGNDWLIANAQCICCKIMITVPKQHDE